MRKPETNLILSLFSLHSPFQHCDIVGSIGEQEESIGSNVQHSGEPGHGNLSYNRDASVDALISNDGVDMGVVMMGIGVKNMEVVVLISVGVVSVVVGVMNLFEVMLGKVVIGLVVLMMFVDVVIGVV